MLCPYCNSELSDGTPFCPKCGQAISHADLTPNESDTYWSKAAEDQKKHDDQYQILLETEVKNVKGARAKRFSILLALIAVIILAVFIVQSVNKSNEEKLSIAAASVIGKTYTDTVRIPPQTLLGSAHPEVQTLVINSNGTANYRYDVGDYSSGWDYDIEYTKEEGTYKYELTISFFGNVRITLISDRGVYRTFAVTTGDDGTVRRIEMFD